MHQPKYTLKPFLENQNKLALVTRRVPAKQPAVNDKEPQTIENSPTKKTPVNNPGSDAQEAEEIVSEKSENNN